MNVQSGVEPLWAVITIWVVVNAVNLLQGSGFVSRVWTGSMVINQGIGYVILGLALPAAIALSGLIQKQSDLIHRIGPILFLMFAAMLLVVDYLWPVEFRFPARLGILVPFLMLFFGSILLMGFPMFRTNLRLWLITVATTVFHLVSMVIALRRGVG